MSDKDNKAYYDTFAEVYENERHGGYHRLIDDLEFSVLKPYAQGTRVLEAGCGTGLILERAAKVAHEAKGVDLSTGMLEKARARGLDVCEGDLTRLPFADNTFDVVYSFKVLPHVERIREAVAELSRVTRPGGHLLLEFYNPASLRGLVKALKPATPITGDTDDHQVFTRYDRLHDIVGYAPRELRYVDHRGIRVATPFAGVFRFGFGARLFSALETPLVHSPLARFAGFLVVIFEKATPDSGPRPL